MTETNGLEERELLTSQQAKKLFLQAGYSEATFHRRVSSGQIESVLPQGRKRGAFYPKEQVLAALGLSRKTTVMRVQVKPSTFSRATVDDLPAMAEVLETHFTRISVDKRRKWLERNPDVAYVLKSEGKAVGCAFVMPLLEEKILHIMNAPIKPPTRSQDIQVYEPGKHYTLYVRSVVVLQSVSRIQRKHWGAKLIADLIKEIIKMGKRGIIIDKVYAQTDSKRIERLLQNLGFTQMVSPSPNKNFVLDVESSGSVFAMKYKQALSKWLGE